MFRLMFAEHLRQRIPDATIVGTGIPEWNVVLAPRSSGAYVLLDKGHKIDVERVLSDVSRVDGVVIACYSQRLEYFEADRHRFIDWFKSPVAGQVTHPDELVIHVRALDVLRGVHPDYMPVPVSYYRQLVDSTGLKPVFVGQTGPSYYMDELHRTFPGARFLPRESWVDDFQTVRNAHNIALSVSSFSWLAAWLSQTAQRIYVPQLGILNPLQRPEIDLAPQTDPRYVFQPFPVVEFRARREQIDWVLEGTPDAPPPRA